MHSPTPAWLFDVYPHERLSSLVVWVKHGSHVTKRLVPFQPEFCVTPDQNSLADAERILAEDSRVESMRRDKARLWLRGEPQDVLRVKPKRFQDTWGIATDLRRATHSKGFTFFDVDDQPESRWMHQEGLWSMCRLQTTFDGQPVLAADLSDERFIHDYQDPDLRCVHLRVIVDAEGTARDTETFADDLLAIHIDDRVIQVGTMGCPDEEREVLRELHRQLQRMDPDVVFTKHGDRFDIPYLLTRIHALGLQDQIWLGRDRDPLPGRPDQKDKSIHTYGRWLYKTHAYYLRGRWHMDLSKKTLDSEDDRKDIHGILYLARVSNRRAQDVNRNGAGYALQQMQIDAARNTGVALPWKRNLAEDWKNAATLCAVDRGGQIMVPKPGIVGDVVACDFSGYYPSLVVAHNLSSDTINCNCCPDGPMVPELGYHTCTKIRGHQADVLARLNPHRKWAKAVLRHAKFGLETADDVSKARAIKSEHKALGVVCFGYFRYRNARFGCAEVHQAIQCYGRRGMTDARRVAQEDEYTMVHTMTDCTFLHKPGATHQDAVRIARRITNRVGVPMDVEGVYKWVVFLPSKVHSNSAPGVVGVPNRYYGKFLDGTIKVRGIDVQRHSTPDWIHDIQQRMLDYLGVADTPREFVDRVPAALSIAKAAADDLRCNRVDPRTLSTMVQSTRSVEEYTAATNTRTALHRLRDAGTERRPGEYIKYVVARLDGPKESRVVPVELFDKASPWFGNAGVACSVRHHLRLLARSVETLLAPFGCAEDPVYEWLLGRAPQPRPATAGPVDVQQKPDWVPA